MPTKVNKLGLPRAHKPRKREPRLTSSAPTPNRACTASKAPLAASRPGTSRRSAPSERTRRRHRRGNAHRQRTTPPRSRRPRPLARRDPRVPATHRNPHLTRPPERTHLTCRRTSRSRHEPGVRRPRRKRSLLGRTRKWASTRVIPYPDKRNVAKARVGLGTVGRAKQSSAPPPAWACLTPQMGVSGSWPLWRSSSHPPRGRERLISVDRRLCGPHAAGRPLAEILLIPGQGSCTLPAPCGTATPVSRVPVGSRKRGCGRRQPSITDSVAPYAYTSHANAAAPRLSVGGLAEGPRDVSSNLCRLAPCPSARSCPVAAHTAAYAQR
jgi:hypothetical protein